jgi:quercetin dioxygenase-like cupin family protein
VGPAPYFYRSAEAELRWFGRTSTWFLADGESTGGEFALVDERATQGETVPRHRHDDAESFYVVEGELTVFVGDEGTRLGPGGFAHVPAGTAHGFRIESEAARYLLLTTPRHGDFYRAITAPAREDGSPPAEPIRSEQIKRASRDYGIEFVGPLPDAD